LVSGKPPSVLRSQMGVCWILTGGEETDDEEGSEEEEEEEEV
jgi:hypothetical protein